MDRNHSTPFLLRLAAVLIVLNLMMFLNGAAYADSEGAGTVTASALNLRSEASVSSPVLACLPKGTVVLVTDKSGDWYKVWYQGKEGYMSSDYISFSETADASFGTGAIQGDGVRVRSGPGTSSSILASCSTGATMPVTGVSGSWYQVSYNGSKAYVSSAYMTLSAGTSSSSSGTSSSGTSTAGAIKGDYVRLRSGPGTGYSILGTYNSGTGLTVTGSSGDWKAVTCDGKAGYVYGAYVTTDTSSSSSSSGKTMTVNAAVNVRSGPGSNYSVLTWYARGQTVTVTGTSGSWSKISYNGGSAYVFSSYLTSGELSAEAPASSSSGSSVQQQLVSTAKNYLGVPYVYGGTSPSGFDCSGFVYYVYKLCGYSIYRTATAQYQNGSYVSRGSLQPGDIIIFYNSAMTSIGHAGIYVGDNQFIHASSGSGKVVISSLSASYYNSHYYGARRVA